MVFFKDLLSNITKKHAFCVLFSGGDGEIVSKCFAFHCTRTFSKLRALSIHSSGAVAKKK